MSRPPTMPDSLASVLRFDHRGLSWGSGEAKRWRWAVLGLFLGGVATVLYSFLGLGTGDTTAAAIAGVLGGAIGLVPIVWGVVWSQAPTHRLIGDDVWLGGRRPVHQVHEVRLGGAPGERATIHLATASGAVQVLSARPLVYLGWTPEGLVWFAEHLAASLEVPLASSFDQAAWAEWQAKGEAHVEDRFRRDLHTNRQAMARWHDEPPREPTLTYAHDEVRVDVGSRAVGVGKHTVTLDRHAVTFQGRSWPLDTIDEVGVIYWRVRGKGTERTRGRVVLLVDGIQRGLVSRGVDGDPSVAGQLNWLAARVRDAVATAHDRGCADEVPAALQALHTTPRRQPIPHPGQSSQK